MVHDAITNLEGNNRLMECSRPSLRQERSFRDIIRRLDDLDFDMAHAGMLFKVMQEVVCEALGALESDVLWQVGQWADLDQRARQEVTQRLDRIETQFSSKMPKALAEGPRMICAPEDIQTIQVSGNVRMWDDWESCVLQHVACDYYYVCTYAGHC